MEVEENPRLRSPRDQGIEATESESETIFFYCMIFDDNEGDKDDAMEVHQGLRLRDRAVFYASFHNISRRQPGPRDTDTCSVGQVI
ncbi:hypothetical protein ACOMHN_014427 [Nucella lapillus]